MGARVHVDWKAMSKKLINAPERAVDEALAGLVAVYPGLRLLEGYRVIVRADIRITVQQSKVRASSCDLCKHEKTTTKQKQANVRVPTL